MFLISGIEVFCIIASILLLLALVAFVYYCMKGGNLIIGLIITTTFWVLVGIVYAMWNGSIKLGSTEITIGTENAGRDYWNMFVGILNTSVL